jgi:glycerol-3-phosphate acyltransferase PlsY
VSQILLDLAAGYLIGSIPFAYLLTRKTANVDIRVSGSGNVGGYNAFIVTRSKSVGIAVGVLDAAKGVAAVLVAEWFFPGSYLNQSVALAGAIVGHNYPVWIRFRGGRGLATTAGGMIFLGLSYSVVWSILWLIAKSLKRDILTSNLVAILLSPLVIAVLPWEWVRQLIYARVDSASFIFFCCTVSILLLISHLDAVRAIWKGVELKDTEPPQSTK